MAARTPTRPRPAPGATSASGRDVVHVAVLGDLIVDVAARVEGPILTGSDTPGTIRFRQGGSAANTARWLVRAGARATFIGAVGRDDWGGPLTAALAADGVIVHAPRMDGPTARLVALITPDGERSFVTDRGAAMRLTAAAVRAAWLRDVAVLHLPAYSLLAEPLAGAARRAAGLAREHGAAISVDLASAGPLAALGRAAVLRLLRDLAPDLLFGNQAEVETLTGAAGGQALLEVAPVVVVKAGGFGCRVITRGRADVAAGPGLDLAVPTRTRAATDTTGAGDAFDAGFLAVWAGLSPGERHAGRGLTRAARAGHRTAGRLLAGRRIELRLATPGGVP